MNRERFEEQHGQSWGRLEAVLGALENSDSRRRRDRRREGPLGEAAELPALYRQVCHHLALARARHYGADLVESLNRLALRGHQQLYRGKGISWGGMATFILRDFPRHVRREAALVLLASVLFFGSHFAMSHAVAREPELIYTVLGSEVVAEFEEMYDPEARQARGSAEDFLMFGYYIYNNISIAFRTFASGLFAGIGAIFILIYNGVMIGAVTGHLTNGPGGEVFRAFVITHGAFELPAIVLAGVAGLKLGLSVLMPGRRQRREALRLAARESLPIVYGVIGMLIIAAFIEAFWSSSTLPAEVRRSVGTLAWLGVGAYFLLVGREGGWPWERQEGRHGS